MGKSNANHAETTLERVRRLKLGTKRNVRVRLALKVSTILLLEMKLGISIYWGGFLGRKLSLILGGGFCPFFGKMWTKSTILAIMLGFKEEKMGGILSKR